MCDEKAPWGSRVKAAAALSTRLRGPGSAEATALLGTIVEEASIPVSHRLAAAEALSECGGSTSAQRRSAGYARFSPTPTPRGGTAARPRSCWRGLGDQARRHAVEMLTVMLDDPWLPDNDLADVAAGLVELGVEFHDRCADVFRVILGRSPAGSLALRDAAVGLASLGPQHLSEAVGVLTLMAADRRLSRSLRLRSTAALAELGPEARLTAARLVTDIAGEFDIEPHEVWNTAKHLADVGLHDHALRALRAGLSSSALSPNHRLWAARELAAIGPDQRDEAVRELRRVADDPRSGEYDRARALAELAGSGEPHRELAIASLRGMLTDGGAEAARRCAAATELVSLGPEFHAEVVEYTLAIASRHTEPNIRARAWHLLRNVDPGMRHRALAELRDLVRPEAMALWDAHRDRWMASHYTDTDEPQPTATAFMAVLGDSTVTGKLRAEAAEALIGLRRQFQRAAFDGVVAVLRSQPLHIGSVVNGISWRVGAGPRAELIEMLRETARQPLTSPAVLCQVATALEKLNHWSDTEVIAALRVVVDDGTVDPGDRADAAVALARAAPEELSVAAEVVLRSRGEWTYLWNRRVRALVTLGADLSPKLRELMANTDIRSSWRVAAAAMLIEVCPEAREDAFAELRALSNDGFLSFVWRADAMCELAQADARARTDMITRCGSILDDEHQAMWNRCEAAYQLAELDESLVDVAMAALRRFATSTRFAIEDRWFAVYQFARLCRQGLAAEVNELGLALTREPTSNAYVRGQVYGWLSGKARLEVERSLLADRTAAPSRRVNKLDTWEHHALGERAEEVLRDVLSAADSTAAERVEAAAALGELAPRHLPEAICLLSEAANGQAGTTARIKLAGLSLGRAAPDPGRRRAHRRGRDTPPARPSGSRHADLRSRLDLR